MLDSHPDLAVPPESYFLVPLLRNRAGLEGTGGVRVAAVADYLRENPSLREWELDTAPLFARWAEQAPASVPDAARDLYAAYAEARGKRLVGDKTPHHVRTVPLLAEAFPEAVFVHLIRDGRQVARSLQEVHFGPRTFVGGVEFWKLNVERGRRDGAALGDRYLEVRYEALVDDPQRELTAICDRLGLAFSPTMLEYHERADELLGGLRRADHLANVGRPPARRERSPLSPAKEEVFAAAAGGLATELGYGPVGHVGLRARATVEVYGGWQRLRLGLVRRRKQLGARVGHRPIQKAARTP